MDSRHRTVGQSDRPASSSLNSLGALPVDPLPPYRPGALLPNTPHAAMAPEMFPWVTFDARALLPTAWQEEIIAVARAHARRKVLVTRHSTSRESRSDFRLPTRSVAGDVLARELPWLRTLYETSFRTLAQSTTVEPVSVMCDRAFGIALNIQTADDDRYECHVDSNPIEGLLYVTSHREGEGGELVVANHEGASNVEEVDAHAAVIEPKAGHLVFFDGRRHSHYVRRLTVPDSMRVVAAMNYYVPSCPEEHRPRDLNLHLLGRLPEHTVRSTPVRS